MSLNDPVYRMNRRTVERMSRAMCERCFHLMRKIVNASECDHLIPRYFKVDHSLENLWMLCRQCHNEKSGREKHHKPIEQPFYERIDPATGWPFDGDDLKFWQEYIVKRNKDYHERKIKYRLALGEVHL